MHKILILDDDKALCMLYADELEEEGYEVVTTGDGSRLMKLIEQEKPCLVVLDIRLGQCSGLDLLQNVRNTYYDLPVILCTAYSAFREDLKSIAADYYVVKSSDLSELKWSIRMALETDHRLPGEKSFQNIRQTALHSSLSEY